jgi:two-component system, OmpR family, phosphate regulon sensor histidine kinase PhoR
MRLPVFTRVFVGYLLVIVALSAASLLAFADTFRDHYRRMLSDNLGSLALSLAPEAGESAARSDFSRLESYVTHSGAQLKTRITVVDAKGVVLADSVENPRTMENHRNRPEVAEALNGSTGKSARFSSTTNQEALYVAVPLVISGRVSGALRTSIFVKDLRFPPGLMSRMIKIGLLLSVLALIGALFLSRSISRPIRELTEASKTLASGDFGARVFFRRKDEFKQLADTFNGMSREISATFEELGRQKAELKSIIDSLREGLVVVDRRGTIIYCNESLKGIINYDPTIKGALYWEVTGEPRFLEVMEKARTGRLDPLEEVEIGGKAYLCSATKLEEEGETVLVLHDITSRRDLERIKRELVSNVSHELRTPLTSIKGFAETLEEEVDEKQKHYVEVIRRNTDRLINIVRDLLLLSQIEEKSAGLEREEVNLKGLAQNTMRIFAGQAREKGISMQLSSSPDLPPLSADPFKIEQLLINLLDNAIKYTDEGEVTVVLDHDGKTATIEVGDTGIGIPQDKLPHIFERFYVVDKSRSRKTGGTGLGLSIVKHIVLLHNGDVSVESTPGKGTRFLVKLPLRHDLTET